MSAKVDEDFRTGNLALLKNEANSMHIVMITEKIGFYNYDACQQFAKIAFNGSPFADSPLIKLAPVQVDNGVIYEGEWVKSNPPCIRMGRGVQRWPDGSRYEGYWREGQAWGPGRLIHANGDCYEGIWREGQACGQGIYVHADGSRYIGEFYADN